MESWNMNKSHVKDFLGSGFKFPICPDKITGRIMMSQHEEDIKEAVYLIIMTRKGERVMRPEFGCGIHEYAFAIMNYTNIKAMEIAVKEALNIWEPRIIHIDVSIKRDEMESGKLNILLSYVVRSTNNPYNLVYPFYLNEGIN